MACSIIGYWLLAIGYSFELQARMKGACFQAPS
jgi:hypothetical protein